MIMTVRHLTAAVLVFCASAAIAGAQSSESKSKSKPELITRTGCVAAPDRNSRNFTMLDEFDGATYALKGLNVKEYVGKRVEVSGAPPKRFVVAGGLYPSPNAAAQAGAMDPAKAAIEAQMNGPMSASRPGTIDFQVKSVRIVTGTCPQS